MERLDDLNDKEKNKELSDKSRVDEPVDGGVSEASTAMLSDDLVMIRIAVAKTQNRAKRAKGIQREGLPNLPFIRGNS